jgi:hypothetical protein
MNDSDEDKHTQKQLEKILIRSEAEPPLLLFSKIYSSGNIERCKVSTALVQIAGLSLLLLLFLLL